MLIFQNKKPGTGPGLFQFNQNNIYYSTCRATLNLVPSGDKPDITNMPFRGLLNARSRSSTVAIGCLLIWVITEPSGISVLSNKPPSLTWVTSTPLFTWNLAFCAALSGIKVAPILLNNSSADLVDATFGVPASALSVTARFFS